MINQALLKQYQDAFDKDPANQASKHAIARVGINEASVDNQAIRRHTFTFSDETKRGKITNQKASGRCWMFSALNVLRVQTMNQLNVENFEFSQNYTLFCDKLERSNFFLTSIIETADQPLNSRLIAHLLNDPIGDGGQWEMFAGILKKYGSVPKEIMPETFHSSNTRGLNEILANKLREFAARLRQKQAAGASKEELEALKEDQLSFIYNLLVKALGEFPTQFDYAYRDKDNKFHRIEAITPQEFFNKYTSMDLDHMISLINAPTDDKPYNKTYTVKYLGSIVESKPIKYLNVPIEVIKKAAITAIQDCHPVWFGCDVGKMSERKIGIMDAHMYAYEDTLGQGFNLNRAERLDYGCSLLTHAMVFVGVDLDKNGSPLTWKVENSWGKDSGDEGIYSMSDAWFDEYMYQITVPAKYIEEAYQKLYQADPIALEPWDPMGSLAFHQA